METPYEPGLIIRKTAPLNHDSFQLYPSLQVLQANLKIDPEGTEHIQTMLDQKNLTQAKNQQAIEQQERIIANAFQQQNFPVDDTKISSPEHIDQFINDHSTFFVNKHHLSLLRYNSETSQIELGTINTKKDDEVVWQTLTLNEADVIYYLRDMHVNFQTLDFDQMKEFFQTFDPAHTQIQQRSSENALEEQRFVAQAEATFHQQLQETFTIICSDLATFDSKDVYDHKIKRFKEFVRIAALLQQNELFQNNLGEIFMKLIHKKHLLNPALRTILNDLFEKAEKDIFQSFARILFLREYNDRSGEDVMKRIFGLSHEEVWQKRERNWLAVNEHITTMQQRGDSKITIDDLRTMHTLCAKGLIPYFMYGLTSDYHGEGLALARAKRDHYILSVGGNDPSRKTEVTSFEKIERELDIVLKKTNHLISQKDMINYRFNLEMAYRFAEYANMHPHADLNGTMCVFFVVAAQALHHNKKIPQTYHRDMIKRTMKVFGYDPIAIAIAHINTVNP
ncbi:hypothetical protein KC726_06005 [Candidatus Woesebacteria bacterium]|nr:hypothetical protein [Candidatus Woesebacteria bacterium]